MKALSRIYILSLLVLATSIPALSAPPPKKIGKAWITFYWIVDESDYPVSSEAELRDIRGNVIYRASNSFRKDLLMEGTGWLRSPDGRTINYDRKIEGESRFRFTANRFGDGIGNCPLVPYRTLAVDPKFWKHSVANHIGMLAVFLFQSNVKFCKLNYTEKVVVKCGLSAEQKMASLANYWANLAACAIQEEPVDEHGNPIEGVI